jgi:hypothetical protein
VYFFQVNFSFFLKHHVMKTYGVEELQFHALLNRALRKINRQLHALAELLQVKNPPSQMENGGGGVGTDAVVRRKILLPLCRSGNDYRLHRRQLK